MGCLSSSAGWTRIGAEEQRLPLPVGSRHPVRRAAGVFRGGGRPQRALLVAIGVTAAAAGAVLSALPPSISAGFDGSGYRVSDSRLEARGQGIYAGPAAVVVLSEEGGETRAGASTRVNGERMLGGCRMTAPARRESCWFELGERKLSAQDSLEDGAWERVYEDGTRVHIELAGGRPAPVPFPLGR